MAKRTKMLLLSMTTLCVCVALAVGGTFALFTGEVRVNNHLQAGNLSVGLYRTEYTKQVLNSDGLLEPVEEQTKSDAKLDLTANSNKVFQINDTNPAVPQSWYRATIEVENKGSVAFSYGMRILWSANRDPEDKDELLAKQIRVTVEYGDSQSKTFMLDQAGQTVNDVDLGTLLTGKTAEFSVKAEFADDLNASFSNNDVMNQALDFDVQVYAVQKISQ